MPLEPVSEDLVNYMMRKSFDAEDIKGRKIGIFGGQGVGKTKLAAELGESNLLLTDEDGILTLLDWPDLHAKTTAKWYEGYSETELILRACENGQYIGKNGLPIDNVIFDTISGWIGGEIRRSIEDGDIDTEKGRLAANIPSQPHYLLSEQNFIPLMKMIAQMQNCSVTLLSHDKTGDKTVPGVTTRADLHGAAYKVMMKYLSLMGYMTLDDSGVRKIQVMPGMMISAKSRVRVSKPVLNDTEFIEMVKNWKAGK